ncbi:MAG: twin-arginine translocase subunit TatB [Rhodospirillales bacterium]|nr:twin-arginine translocase subunit TatB [Rhodospirillales bacterium]
MFDIGWQELFILAVLAIIVIGPKDLPRAIRSITKWIRKARSMARDLQDGLDEVVREADLDDLKKEIEAQDGLDIGKRIGNVIDPTGDFAKDMDLDKDVYDEMSEAVDDLKISTAPEEIDKPEKTKSAKTGSAAPKAKKSKKASG